MTKGKRNRDSLQKVKIDKRKTYNKCLYRLQYICIIMYVFDAVRIGLTVLCRLKILRFFLFIDIPIVATGEPRKGEFVLDPGMIEPQSSQSSSRAW